MLVIAFAQCFYTLLQLDCTTALATTPVCSVRDAYRVVFMLIRGESLVDPTGVNQFSEHATIFLLALLVTVLTASSQLDFEQIALQSYWEPILGFVLSTSIFVNTDASTSQTRTFEVKKAHLWDMFTQTLFGGVPSTGKDLFVYPLRSYIFTWIIALFIVPLWFLLGLLSLGLLWPPQVRRYVFRSPTMLVTTKNNSNAKEKSRLQISEMHNEILQMKCMAYERSCMLENEIRNMKELLVAAMQD
jgi:hypothetical protein